LATDAPPPPLSKEDVEELFSTFSLFAEEEEAEVFLDSGHDGGGTRHRFRALPSKQEERGAPSSNSDASITVKSLGIILRAIGYADDEDDKFIPSVIGRSRRIDFHLFLEVVRRSGKYKREDPELALRYAFNILAEGVDGTADKGVITAESMEMAVAGVSYEELRRLGIFDEDIDDIGATWTPLSIFRSMVEEFHDCKIGGVSYDKFVDIMKLGGYKDYSTM